MDMRLDYLSTIFFFFFGNPKPFVVKKKTHDQDLHSNNKKLKSEMDPYMSF